MASSWVRNRGQTQTGLPNPCVQQTPAASARPVLVHVTSAASSRHSSARIQGVGMTERPAPWASPTSSDSSRRGDRHGVTARDLIVGVVSGVVVTAEALFGQNMIDDKRDTEAERRENLRFIREQSANDKTDDVSFHGIDLGGRNLGGLDLHGADLSGANRSHADLTFADFTGAILNEADLTGAYVMEADFTNAKLAGAIMTGATVISSNFTGASLLSADMRDLVIPGISQGSNFIGANLEYTDFTGAEIDHSQFDGATMFNTNFSGADLSSSEFSILTGEIDPQFVQSICYDNETIWPKVVQPEDLVELQCEAMKN